MTDRLDEMVEQITTIRDELLVRRDSLQQELGQVNAQLDRAEAAITVMAPPPPPKKKKGETKRAREVTSGRERQKLTNANQARVLKWAQKRADWFTVVELADELKLSSSRVGPTVGRLADADRLERIRPEGRRPPRYRFPPAA